MGGHPGFVNYLIEQGLSPGTIRVYAQAVTRASTFMDLATVTAVTVAEYAGRLAPSHSTRGQLRCALKHWYQFTGADGPWRAVRVPPQPEMLCRALSPEAARDLAKVAVGWYPNGLATLLGLYLALRRGEIAGAEWSRLRGDYYTVTGKGSKTATLPVHPVLLHELQATTRGSPWVFPGRLDGHASVATVWRWVKDCATEAGIPEITTHQLRHTCLATANDNTQNLRAVQSFARHSKPQTTSGYTRTTEKRLREVSDALDYLN